MVCIYCGQSTHVTNSRLQKRQNTIWRRRMCDVCGNIFSTQEQPIRSQGLLVHSPKRKQPQPFSRDMLFLSIYEACKHRTRAIAESGALTDTIMAIALPELENGIIERDMLVHTAHTVLGRFDTIAADLYAAYHPIPGLSIK